MSYNLYLLRHAKSDWKDKTYDFDRPITDKGKRAAQRIGVWMAGEKINPEMIISSPAKRAMLTTEKMLKANGQGIEKIRCDRRLYLADKKDLIKLLKEIPDKIKSVLIVAHNPGLEDLLLSLLDKQSKKQLEKNNTQKLFPTACFAQLKFEQPWKKMKSAKASLKKIIYPKDLPKGFPYPLPTSKERRIRPSYYYQQSAVIPYRIEKGKLQVLIISSSQNNHFVIPKGIIEPGLTPQQSAEIEAFEEAGIKGIVSLKKVGKYATIKWKAKTTVEVFSMKVKEVLDERFWSEKHRGREWVSINKAIKVLHQKELKPLLLKFKKCILANSLKKQKLNK
jgi:phosphohistidine phosphatase